MMSVITGHRAVVVPIYPKGLTIEERFKEFHRANPHVYQAIVDHVADAHKQGVKKWSLRGIFHVLRWNSALYTLTNEPWKLNNDFTPFYARKIMKNYPQFAGFFELRESRADNGGP